MGSWWLIQTHHHLIMPMHSDLLRKITGTEEISVTPLSYGNEKMYGFIIRCIRKNIPKISWSFQKNLCNPKLNPIQ